ncbi:hypothetical protein [Thalassotalea crassostreae]|uniref:hypothetical protein n=1 Tax=Thalassotalea crassostreae TaxID=1763536 RepID=UPI000838A91C|nr:hypothetical protein [Thalassotalea crassostreae]
MNRRIFVKLVYSYLASTAICHRCFASESGWPQKGVTGKSNKGEYVDPSLIGDASWPSPTISKTNDFLNKKVGCALKGAESSEFRDQIKIVNSSGNSDVDRMMRFETNVMRDFIGVNPKFAFFDDGSSPNAFATPEKLLGGGDGTVIFGKNLLWDQVNKRGKNIAQWSTAIVGIMAHEWAHIKQFKMGINVDGKQQELHSDFVAGWLLAIKASGGRSFNIKALANSLYEIGDENFNSPNHHGTPNERVNAMWAGWNQVFRYNVINGHYAFMNGLKYVGLV